MGKNGGEIAVFVDDVDRLGRGGKLELSELPVHTDGRRVVFLECDEVPTGGRVTMIVGVADTIARDGASLTFTGVTPLDIPIVVGTPRDAENLRPDLIPCKGWGPRDFVYLSAGTVTRVRAEVARLMVHREANRRGSEAD